MPIAGRHVRQSGPGIATHASASADAGFVEPGAACRALLQEFAGVAGGLAWFRPSSRSLLDRDLFKLRSMPRHRLARHLRPDPEGTFDNAHFAPDPWLKLEGLGPLLPEGAHDPGALDRGAGGLH